MPLEAGALLLDAVGWGKPLWFLCGAATDVLLRLAHTVASAKGAVAMLPSMPVWAFGLVAAGVAVLGVFGRRQARLARGGRAGRSPLVDPTVLERRAYVSGLVLVVCFIGAMGGMILVFNVMLQAGLGFTPLGSGVATIGIPVAAIFGSITSSVTLARLGRKTIQIGAAVMAFGLLVADLVLRARGGSLSAWDLSGPLFVAGFGMGMIFVPMFDVILAGVEPRQLGSASGLLETIQQLGMSIGIAVVGTVLFSGSLYALALSGIRWLGAITPLGGVAFLLGWLSLALSSRG